MKLSGPRGDHRVAEGHERGAERGRGLGPLPRNGGPGCHRRENFEIWIAIWCNLVHFGNKFTFLQLSTFVNENIAIGLVLDSGIDSN